MVKDKMLFMEKKMKISKRHLKRIIKEEAEALGMMAPSLDAAAAAPAAPMMENEMPEEELVMEMETALSGLEVVMESLEKAGNVCVNCLPEVAAQGPVLQAVAAQVSALQETLEAVGEVVAESVAPAPAIPAAAALPAETVAAIQAEARRQRRRRR